MTLVTIANMPKLLGAFLAGMGIKKELMAETEVYYESSQYYCSMLQ